MRFSADVRLPFPRETVFAVYRDALTRVLEFLPNVRSVEVKVRKDNEGAVHLSHEWHGGGQIPAAVRGVVSESMLGWTDHAIWDLKSFCCDWTVESHKFPDGVHCRGRNSFLEEAGGTTLLEVRGRVDVDARRFPGVPAFLAVSVGRSVEEFLASKIESNVRETSQWFDKYRADLPLASPAPAVEATGGEPAPVADETLDE